MGGRLPTIRKLIFYFIFIIIIYRIYSLRFVLNYP
jgi:hypothetical protein